MLAGRRWSVPDDLIASRCTELESGGRMIDAILALESSLGRINAGS